MSTRILLAATAMMAALATQGAAVAADAAKATLKDADGKEVGSAELAETAHGVLLSLRLEDLPEGTHALHIHETGKCEPPFKSAGGHFNPGGASHGMKSAKGMHAGDLPNIHVASSSLRLEYLAPGVTLADGKKNSLMDDDGAAIVIHEGADDYRSDPAGDAGDRIACGVIEAAGQ